MWAFSDSIGYKADMKHTPHILVVDDHSEIRKSVSSYLERNGMRASSAENAADMDIKIAGAKFDLIVLDVMMPGEDGLSACRRLSKEGHTPILMLTALGDDDDRITGLDGGADDYLAKPFEPKELLLRINAILRRMPDTPAEDTVPKILHLGPIRYDIERGEMWQGDQLVRLTATESQLMKFFSACPHEPISRTKLVEDLGRDRGQAQERAVDVQITRLRRKIEPNPKQPRYLQTVRGAGYMLAPD